VSAYLNNLNSIPPPFEQEFNVEDLDINQDLAMFTNTDFTHFDVPTLPEDGSFNFDLDEAKVEGNVNYEELLAGSGTAQQNFNPPPQMEISAIESSQYPSYFNTPIQPAPPNGFPHIENGALPNAGSGAAGNPSGRKAGSVASTALSSEERSRVAAEEDKRRRNTAASARFRIKKKQREQTLEKTVKEVSDKNSKLEAKLHQLEMENQWLKDLIIEKKGSQSKEEIAAAFQKYRKESEEREVKSAEHKDGVGTD